MLTTRSESADVAVPDVRPPAGRRRLYTELLTHLSSVALTVLAMTAMMRLWRAHLSIPLWYTDGALADAAYFKTTAALGWYDRQPDLGVPYGRHDPYTSSPGDLSAVLIKVLTSLTDRWAVAFNLFFLIGFPLAAMAAVWFFRQCGLRPSFAVVLSVLFAVAPYHFLRNESQLFSSAYFCLPLVMVLVLRALRGQPLWGRRRHRRAFVALLTGRGAGTLAVLVVLACSGADYALFGALLFGFGGLCGVLRTRSRRHLGGIAAAAGALGTAYLLAVLPVLLRSADSAPTGPSGLPGAETYAMKFASLLLPAPGQPIAVLARARAFYDAKYPSPGESPALGLVAACGFIALLLMALTTATGRSRRSDPVEFGHPPGATPTLGDLALLAVFTFCLGTIGGLGTIVSATIGGFGDWGRLSIVLALLCLAAVGMAMELASAHRSTRGSSAAPAGHRFGKAVAPVLGLLVLAVGLTDQSLTGAVPAYPANAASSDSDQHFVDEIQRRVPAGSMIFQLPWQPFSNSGAANDPPNGRQLALWLHSSTLRWSAGGVRGRPQTDWPGTLTRANPAKLVRDLAAIGFVGITVDRQAPPDARTAWLTRLHPVLGAPLLTSLDQRYAYLPLTTIISNLDRTTTSTQRSAIASAVTGVQP